jgi:hypothetical protein
VPASRRFIDQLNKSIHPVLDSSRNRSSISDVKPALSRRSAIMTREELISSAVRPLAFVCVDGADGFLWLRLLVCYLRAL